MLLLVTPRMWGRQVAPWSHRGQRSAAWGGAGTSVFRGRGDYAGGRRT